MYNEYDAIHNKAVTAERGYASAGPSEDPIPKSGSISKQLEDAERLTDMLAKALSELDQRLSPVLRPTPPAVAGDRVSSGTATPLRSAQADMIAQINMRLSMFREHVAHIIGRIDL